MKRVRYKVRFKIPRQVYDRMLKDLVRKHDFAYERVGFLFTTSKIMNDSTLLILAKEYVPVEDGNYIKDFSVGAKINNNAIRQALQRILDNSEGCFHVHMHYHKGLPSPSKTDKEGLTDLVNSFTNVSNKQANGTVILSQDSIYVDVNIVGEKKIINPELVTIIGYPFNILFQQSMKLEKATSMDRQAFLGKSSEQIFKTITVGIVGYGGGGSHIGQQLAHLGVKNIIVFDDDQVEATNLNRLVGAVYNDAKAATRKTIVASRLIKKIIPDAKVICVNSKWQQYPELIQKCDVVFGCVDSYSERQQLESECRRYLIPYLDIGMDVYKVANEPYLMSGQIILSLPGEPCMSCLGFLTEKKLGLEAVKYGKVGGRPQVVWANGVLASTAIGIFVDLVTGWTRASRKLVYLQYDGNSGLISEHVRSRFAKSVCSHYRFDNVGVPVFRKIG